MRVFFVDPQSYNNLSVYDTSLMSGLEDCDITYFHNIKYQCKRLDGVRYCGVFTYSDKKGIFKALSYVCSVCQIMWASLVFRPDVVHVQWFRLFQIDKLMVLLFRMLNVNVVYTAHNIMPHNPKASDRSHYLWYYHHVDAIVVHTQRSKVDILREFNLATEKVHVIPHGILPSTVNESVVEARMNELRDTLHTDGCMVFASMGFQNYYKGIDIITEVWQRCKELHANKDCRLLVIGKVENADVTALQQYANVCVVNEMTSDVDFDAYLRLANVVLLPYREISQSGVLLTALQRGIPVAVADVGGLTDPFQYGNIGWCMGEPNADNLKKILLYLLDNEAEVIARKNDKTAFETIRKAYSWINIGHVTSCLYKSLKK